MELKGDQKKEYKNDKKESIAKAIEELSKREISSSENLDRSILSTSLAILGASFALFKYSKNVFCVELFYISALILLVAVISVICSFRTAKLATDEMRKLLNEYRRSGKKTDPKWDKYTTMLNWLSFWCYLIGVILMAWFFGLNLQE